MLGVGLRLVVVLAVGCGSPVPPTPTPTPTASAPSTGAPSSPAPSATAGPTPSPPPREVGPLALEECDQLGYIPCEHQAAILRTPIAGTGIALVYSSEWAPGRLDRPGEWDVSALGLGGWSLDVLQRYDAGNGILLSGDGGWRHAQSVPISDGEFVLPTFDGRYAYVFDAEHRHRRTVDAILGIDLIVFAYDDAGRLSSARGTLNGQPIDLSVERQANGEPEHLLGAGGASTGVINDGAGHIEALVNPDGGREVAIADSRGLITTYVDPDGGRTAFEYDAAGRLVTATDADGVTVGYARSASDNDVQATTSLPLGGERIYRTRVLDEGTERTYVAPGGATTNILESVDGQRTVALPDGTRLTIGLSPDARWGSSAPTLTPAVEERPDGVVRRVEIEQVVDPMPDDLLHLAAWSRTTTINGDKYVQQVDPARRALTLTDPLGRRTTSVYDDRGRLVSFSAPGQPADQFGYDGQGRLMTETRGIGSLAQTTSYSYDDAGQVTVTRPDGATEQLTLDAVARIVQRLAGDGSSVLSTYDSAGREILIRPGGAPSTTLGHSPAGRLTAFVPPALAADSSYEVVAYDDGGRVARVDGPGQRQISMAYDDAGRLDQISFTGGQLDATYDPVTGQLVRITGPDAVQTTYSYVGTMPSAVTLSGPVAGDVRLGLDHLGRVVSESINSGPPTRLTYDGGGALSAVGSVVIERDGESGLATGASLGVAQLTRQFDANGLLTGITATVNGALRLELSYERDALGRVIQTTENNTAGQHVTEYGYDPAGRLTTVAVDGTAVEDNAYDSRGNRVSAGTSGSPTLAEYDARDELRRWAGVTYDYRPDGTLARRVDGGAASDYQIDDLGVLRRVVLPDGSPIDYVVDWSGLPIGRIVGGRLEAGYLYRPDGHLVAELDGSGQVVARFGYDDRGRLVSMERGGSAYLIVTDHLGSPRLIIDAATGEVAQAIDYDAWGRVISDSTPGFQPFGFGGGLRDIDTGLVHFGARDYDPTVGRWIEPDPIRFESGDANLYAYSGDDPVNRSDPSGLGPFDPPPPQPWPPGFDPGQQCRGMALLGCGPQPPGPPWKCFGLNWKCGPPGGGSDGACYLALYCKRTPGGFTCLAFQCNPPGGGICLWYCSLGDPHIRTADRLDVSFQGAGEYLMVASADGKVVIQARQEPPGSATILTITTAVAASVAGDRVGVYLGDELALRVNGEALAGIDITRGLPNGGSVTRHGTSIVVEWPDGSRLTVDRHGNHLDYGFQPDSAIAPSLTGLMGTPDGDFGNDLISRDRSLVLSQADPDFFTKLHGPFGDSWRISQQESLFDYAPGESTATFTRPDVPRAPATTDAVEPEARAAAEELCRAVGVTSEPTLSDCIVDVGLTGDPSYAASAAAAEAATATMVRGADAAPILIGIGATVVGATTSADETDRYTFVAAAGQAIYLDALSTCDSDLSWRLAAPSGSNSSQSFVCQDIGRQELTETGNYTIEIFAPTGSTATGTYAFVLLPARTSEPSPVAFGQPTTGAISQVGDRFLFTFDATAGQTIYLDARGRCVDGIEWRLIDPTGRRVAGDPACADIGRVTLDATGPYTVDIYPTEAVTGPFAFAVFDIPPPRESAIAIGATVSDAIAAVGETHRYAFDATAGQVIVLHATGACVDKLEWRLISPSGIHLGSAPSCFDVGLPTLPESGRYTIEVYSPTTATGAYSFELRAGP